MRRDSKSLTTQVTRSDLATTSGRLDPGLNVASPPNPAGPQFCDRPWEILIARELIYTLGRHPE